MNPNSYIFPYLEKHWVINRDNMFLVTEMCV